MVLLNAGRSLATGQALCNLDQRQLWVSYIALGGSRCAEELLDYINDVIAWPGNEHDAAAYVLNERCHELGLGLPVPYADEL
jgi:hypothetical protein